MLYAMVLLIVTIFYIILAIVKNRYNTNEALVEQAVNYMTDNDDYALSGDRTPPIVVFSDNNEVFNSGRSIKIYIYDDDEGSGLVDINSSQFVLTDNGNSFKSAANCTTDSKKIVCTYQLPNANQTKNITVKIEDKAGNKTVENRTFIVTPTGPNCTDVTVSSDDPYNFNSTTLETVGGVTIYYDILCKATNSHGMDASVLKSDITVSNGEVTEIKTQYGIDNVKIRISVEAATVENKTMTVAFRPGYGISDAAGNKTRPNLPDIKIKNYGEIIN